MTSLSSYVRWAAAGLALTSAACKPGSGASADSVYIGVAASRTSDTYFQGVQLALDELNARRPPGAPPLAMRLPPDSQASQVAVAAAFRDDPSVIGVVGHTGSNQTMEAGPIYADREDGGRRALVAVSPSATNPAVTIENDWIFRVCPTDIDAVRALARFTIDSVRARRVAIIYRNDLFGRGFLQALVPELERGGVTIVERDPHLTGITEPRAYALRIARRDVDAVLIPGAGNDAVALLRALRAAGSRAQLLGTDDVSIDATRRAAELEALRGVRYTAFYDAKSATSPVARRFAEAYRQRFGSMPSPQAALSYDAALVIGEAAFAAGADRRKVRDWIAGVGRDHPAIDGVTGAIQFDGEGDAVGKTVVIGMVGR